MQIVEVNVGFALRRDIPVISQRMLTLDLRALEESGVVKRTVLPTVPVTVEYELTADGRRLEPVVEVMKHFRPWVKGRECGIANAPVDCAVDRRSNKRITGELRPA